MIPMNLHVSHNLFGDSMAFMGFTLDIRGITPSLLTQKLRYSISVHLKNYFSIFTFNPISAGFCETLFRSFRWSMKSFLVITSATSIYDNIVSNPSKILEILCWKLSWMF